MNISKLKKNNKNMKICAPCAILDDIEITFYLNRWILYSSLICYKFYLLLSITTMLQTKRWLLETFDNLVIVNMFLLNYDMVF